MATSNITNVDQLHRFPFTTRVLVLISKDTGFDHLTDINTIDDEDEHEGIDIRMSRDGNYVVFVNTNPVKEETRNVKFSRYFDINKFRPDYLMIYTDIIEQSIVGNSFSKLVKIVHHFKFLESLFQINFLSIQTLIFIIIFYLS